MLTDKLVRIMAAGGGVSIDAKGKLTDSLVRIASAGRQSGATLTIRNADSMLTDSCVRIAAANPGHVQFVFNN